MAKGYRNAGLSLAVAGLTFFALLVPSLYARPRPPVSPEMQVALPRFVQVLMAAGDRYLAANLAGFRALVASTETMGAENYHIQGLVQSDAAWLNPAHEDNYYIAAAILPWFGEAEAAQYVLRLANEARPFDWQPAFYYGFNELHFYKRPLVGAEWLRIAAGHTSDDMEQIQLQQLAAQWASRGEDVELSIQMHRAMAKEARNKAFANFLEKRAVRLENLLTLAQAVDRYRERFGKKPAQVSDLAEKNILPIIPSDPFGMSYIIDSNGKPQLASPQSARTDNHVGGGR